MSDIIESDYVTDPYGRTRASSSENVCGIKKIYIIRRAIIQGAFCPPRTNFRPQFTPQVIRHFFAKTSSNPSYRNINNVPHYACKIRGGTTYLPRKQDLPKIRSKSSFNRIYATIGHTKQWRDYVQENADRLYYHVSIDGKEFIVKAYAKKDVERLFNAISNLRLESNQYNSSRAYRYPDEDPLYPEICEVPTEQ